MWFQSYLIELKSSNLEKAILQLKNTYQKLSKILVGYKKFFRVVYNSKTSNLVMNKCKKHKAELDKLNIDLQYKNKKFEENI